MVFIVVQSKSLVSSLNDCFVNCLVLNSNLNKWLSLTVLVLRPSALLPVCTYFSCLYWVFIIDPLPYLYVELWNNKCYLFCFFLPIFWCICIDLYVTMVSTMYSCMMNKSYINSLSFFSVLILWKLLLHLEISKVDLQIMVLYWLLLLSGSLPIQFFLFPFIPFPTWFLCDLC